MIIVVCILELTYNLIFVYKCYQNALDFSQSDMLMWQPELYKTVQWRTLVTIPINVNYTLYIYVCSHTHARACTHSHMHTF
jgi:hypothetical protein